MSVPCSINIGYYEIPILEACLIPVLYIDVINVLSSLCIYGGEGPIMRRKIEKIYKI